MRSGRRSPTRRGRGWLRAGGAVVLGVALGSCGGDASGPDLEQPAEISLSPASTQLVSLGQEVQFTATVRNGLGQQMTGVAITWSSDTPAVLAHAGSGRFRAVANGVATVTASVATTEGTPVEETAQVTVTQQAADITLTRSLTTFYAVGQTDQWAASLFDALGSPLTDPPTPTWTTSNPTVATVSQTGVVTAVGDGPAQITATAGQASASLPIDVSATVPYTLCVSFSVGGGTGPETCTTLTLTVRVN